MREQNAAEADNPDLRRDRPRCRAVRALGRALAIPPNDPQPRHEPGNGAPEWIRRFGPGRDVDEVHPLPWRLPPFMAVLDGISVRRLSLPSTMRAVMIADRRARGFERLGTGGAAALGLAPVRTRQLVIETAWRRVAGRSLAERVTVVDLRRGVLTLLVADPTWRRAVIRLLPELGARFARDHAALGVTRFRFVDTPKQA